MNLRFSQAFQFTIIYGQQLSFPLNRTSPAASDVSVCLFVTKVQKIQTSSARFGRFSHHHRISISTRFFLLNHLKSELRSVKRTNGNIKWKKIKFKFFFDWRKIKIKLCWWKLRKCWIREKSFITRRRSHSSHNLLPKFYCGRWCCAAGPNENSKSELDCCIDISMTCWSILIASLCVSCPHAPRSDAFSSPITDQRSQLLLNEIAHRRLCTGATWNKKCCPILS